MELPTLAIPSFLDIKISLIFNSKLLAIIFIIFSIVYIGLSLVLFYHWYAYGMKSKGVIFAETVFIFISLVLFALAVLAIYYF